MSVRDSAAAASELLEKITVTRIGRYDLLLNGNRCGVALQVFAAAMYLATSAVMAAEVPALDVAVAVNVTPAAESSPARRALTPDDFYRVQDLSAPQVSPDGLWVAYVLSTNDRASDESRSSIWMVSWDGQQKVALTNPAEGTSQPKWSPDGRYLAFIGTPAGSEKPQIMLLDRRGGESRSLTSVNGEIGGYAWSPDGKRLVFAMLPGESDKSPKPIVIDARHFKDDSDGYLASSERHLYLIGVDGAGPEPLTGGSGNDDEAPAWSPDGANIAFLRTREHRPDADGMQDIVVIQPRAGATVRNLARIYSPNSQQLEWSPDSRALAYVEGLEPKLNAYMQDRLFVVPVAGGPPRALTDKLDRAVTSYTFTTADVIDIAVEDDRNTYPARIDLNSGDITRLGKPTRHVVSGLTSATGHTALLQSTDETLAEVFALDGGELRKLTSHNDEFLATLNLGAVEDVEFRSKDGTVVHAILVKPPSFEAHRRYPTILWIHGGPNGQDDHSLAIDGYQFEPQMFAARGFAVLRVNYRGGSGRGIKYAKAIFADWGHLEVQDLLAGVDYLVRRGIADKERLGIGGWSYGGILTDYTIASDSRFKVAVSGAGSGNQLSTYGSDEYILQYENELGVPWKNTAHWLKVSYPFFHADRIHTPTLFVGGDKDFNVPIIGGEQMYEALRSLDVPTQLVVYPGQHHVFSRPSFLKDLAERTTAWIERYLPEAGRSPPDHDPE